MIDGCVQLARFYNHPRAMFVKSLLESQGFDVFTENEHSAVMHPASMIQGIGLLVREEDLPHILDYLKNGVEEDFEEVEEQQAEDAARAEDLIRTCPECDGTDLALRYPGLILLFGFVLLPALAVGNLENWPRRCRACGWKASRQSSAR